MLANVIAALVLVWRTMATFPDAPVVRVVRASWIAVSVDVGVHPALLMAISHHESDLQPNAVSYISRGRRVDLLWDGSLRLPGRVVCGFMSAQATPASCRAMIALDGGMTAGALELAEWMETCRGDVRCSLRGYSSGTACSKREASCSPAAATFARMFYARAIALGMPR